MRGGRPCPSGDHTPDGESAAGLAEPGTRPLRANPSSVRRVSSLILGDRPPLKWPVTVRVATGPWPRSQRWLQRSISGRTRQPVGGGRLQLLRGAPPGVHPAHWGPPGEKSSGRREEMVATAVPPPPVPARSRQASGADHSPGVGGAVPCPGVPSPAPLPLLVGTDSRGSRPHILSRNERRLRPGDKNTP